MGFLACLLVCLLLFCLCCCCYFWFGDIVYLIFFILFLSHFNFSFVEGCYKVEGRIQRNWKMSGIGVNDAKSPKTKFKNVK